MLQESRFFLASDAAQHQIKPLAYVKLPNARLRSAPTASCSSSFLDRCSFGTQTQLQTRAGQSLLLSLTLVGSDPNQSSFLSMKRRVHSMSSTPSSSRIDLVLWSDSSEVVDMTCREREMVDTFLVACTCRTGSATTTV